MPAVEDPEPRSQPQARSLEGLPKRHRLYDALFTGAPSSFLQQTGDLTSPTPTAPGPMSTRDSWS